MVGTRNSTLIKDELIRYITSLGLTLNTVTKARGNRGFFKDGRIDVSKTLDDKSAIRVIVHEFAHYVNYNLDKSLKSLEAVFGLNSDELREELISVTAFVDENSTCKKLNSQREKLKTEIKSLTDDIKEVYPNFSATEKFKEFNNYSRWSDLRYLEKYDRVKVNSIVTSKTYSIKDVKKDFPDISDTFVDYLNLKSKQRKYSKISRRISKLNRYYNEPCELFARFVEGLYMDIDEVKILAPTAYKIFIEKYNKNFYKGMPELFSIIRLII